MEIVTHLKNFQRWPGSTWVKAVVAGLIVLLLFKAIGLWTIIALIGGLVAFVLVSWWLHRDDPLLDADTNAPVVADRSDASGADAAPMGAPATRLYDAPPSGPAPADHTPPAALQPKPEPTPKADAPPRDVTPEAKPAPKPKADAPTAETAGESQRVRDAARAAGEAAKLMAAPAAVPGDAETASETTGIASRKPAWLDAPREGGADDLKRIKGVGPKLEEKLHYFGYYHFDQIAGWSPAEVAWVDANLEGFTGRATRDDWVGQAKTLAAGGETEFSRRVDKGEVYDD